MNADELSIISACSNYELEEKFKKDLNKFIMARAKKGKYTATCNKEKITPRLYEYYTKLDFVITDDLTAARFFGPTVRISWGKEDLSELEIKSFLTFLYFLISLSSLFIIV